MKQILSISFILLCFGFAQAQIGEVKIVGNQAKIYDEDAKFTYHSISMSSNAELADYNSKYIVIVDGNQAKIYDSKGSFTYKSINLCNNCTIRKVTNTAILVKEGNMVKYYDFEGKYTYKYTSN